MEREEMDSVGFNFERIRIAKAAIMRYIIKYSLRG